MGNFNEKWELFTKGQAENPTLEVSVKLLMDVSEGEKKVRAVLSKEITDRDGEVVVISGVKFNDDKKVPLLDSHRMNDTVVENVLGSVNNIRKSKSGGIATLEGDLEFAPTIKGQLAKILVEGGFVDSVSIGFAVKGYDPSTKFITESELYEVSLVSVPANPAAKIDSSKSIKEQVDQVNEVEKMLNHYKTIKAPFKEVTKTFLSDSFCELVQYKKEGNLLLDLNNIYEIILSKFNSVKEETPQAPEITSQEPIKTPELKSLTQEQLSSVIETLTKQAVAKHLGNLI